MLGCLLKFRDRRVESARRRPSGLPSRDTSCKGSAAERCARRDPGMAMGQRPGVCHGPTVGPVGAWHHDPVPNGQAELPLG